TGRAWARRRFADRLCRGAGPSKPARPNCAVSRAGRAGPGGGGGGSAQRIRRTFLGGGRLVPDGRSVDGRDSACHRSLAPHPSRVPSGPLAASSLLCGHRRAGGALFSLLGRTPRAPVGFSFPSVVGG